MSAPALTHHDILAIVEPFARRGRRVDLAASDRVQRIVVFKPLDLPADAPDAPVLREQLRLECRETGSYFLRRTLTHPNGLEATLEVGGAEPARLLERIEAMSALQPFQHEPGYELSRSYDLGWIDGADTPDPALSRALVRLEGMTLAFYVPPVSGSAGELSLQPAPGARPEFPEDLLAVQGWDWARLMAEDAGWKSRIRLRGKGERRTRAAERALLQVARHLARTLAEPPARFHERFLWARWGVVFRRLIPTLMAILLIGGALMLPRFTGTDNSGLWMALHYVPIGLIALSLSLQEFARFEIPPLPWRPRQERWNLQPA